MIKTNINYYEISDIIEVLKNSNSVLTTNELQNIITKMKQNRKNTCNINMLREYSFIKKKLYLITSIANINKDYMTYKYNLQNFLLLYVSEILTKL